MHLLDAIVKLMTTTRYYLLYPKLIRLIATETDEKEIFEKIRKETGEDIGRFHDVPNEFGGFVLLKHKISNEWSINRLPYDINLEEFYLYARYGNQNAFYPLNETDIATILHLKILKKRIYTSKTEIKSTGKKARSIVYENLEDELFEISNKNINITFSHCKNVTVNRLHSPIDGIKLIHCKNVNINVQVVSDKTPIIGVYAFYCDSCRVYIPENYEGSLFTEIHGCFDFHII